MEKKEKAYIYICLMTFFIFFLRAIGQTFEAYGSQAKAAIVDHLSISCPDPAFVNECKDITDKFVRSSMEGNFNDTLIIMMGCTGIKKCAATAFIERGARSYIGWDGPVSACHTDRATIQLLKYLFVEKKNIANALTQTMKDVGREPQYNSTLLFWPLEAGKYMVQNGHNLQAKLIKGE